jgi:hypothetical protein
VTDAGVIALGAGCGQPCGYFDETKRLDRLNLTQDLTQFNDLIRLCVSACY